MLEKLNGRFSTKILVNGWYAHENLGDQLFIQAFSKIFPTIQFVFSDVITVDNLQDMDAVFFGGGSFLYSAPKIIGNAIALLKTKKIFYLGIGVEAEINPVHLELMAMAKLIAIRSPSQFDRVKTINANTYFVPDLVYSLQEQVVQSSKLDRSVLILPNVSILPTVSNDHYKHVAWNYFKCEFAQFADWLVENNYIPQFWPLCLSPQDNDRWAISEIVGHMKYRDQKLILSEQAQNISEITSLVSRHQVVITQRFHGIIFSEMSRTPYIAIHHHTKLQDCSPNNGEFISYYNCSKQLLIDSFLQAIKTNCSDVLPIYSHVYEALSKDVISLL
jgi:polysaccharide pyruvyl transferase WcaK-like protein